MIYLFYGPVFEKEKRDGRYIICVLKRVKKTLTHQDRLIGEKTQERC